MLQTAAAAVAGLALSHTISRAVLSGLFTSDKPFFRTPKMVGKSALVESLAVSSEEILLMCALILSAAAIAFGQKMETLDINLWVTVLLVQSLPYAATLLVALISGLPQRKSKGVAQQKSMVNQNEIAPQ